MKPHVIISRRKYLKISVTNFPFWLLEHYKELKELVGDLRDVFHWVWKRVSDYGLLKLWGVSKFQKNGMDSLKRESYVNGIMERCVSPCIKPVLGETKTYMEDGCVKIEINHREYNADTIAKELRKAFREAKVFTFRSYVLDFLKNSYTRLLYDTLFYLFLIRGGFPSAYIMAAEELLRKSYGEEGVIFVREIAKSKNISSINFLSVIIEGYSYLETPHKLRGVFFLEEIKRFINFLIEVYSKRREERINLDFRGNCIKLAIVFVGRKEVLLKYGIQPYIRRILYLIKDNIPVIYVLARGMINVLIAREMIREIKKRNKVKVSNEIIFMAKLDGKKIPVLCIRLENV